MERGAGVPVAARLCFSRPAVVEVDPSRQTHSRKRDWRNKCLKYKEDRFVDNLDLVSQRLTALAKEHGSSDNITIIVVFLRDVDELVKRYESEYAQDCDEVDSRELLKGLTSTCPYVSGNRPAMNGSQEDVAAAAASNPFASPLVADVTPVAANGSAFDSPAGGAVFGDSPDPFASAAAAAATESAAPESSPAVDSFKQASPSMFEQSLQDEAASPLAGGLAASQSEDRARGGEGGEAVGGGQGSDFMANQEGAWIQQHLLSKGGGGLLPGDSGFISPAGGASNNQSASSEDSAENHADREASPGAGGAGMAAQDDKKDDEDDEEEEEGREVMGLLASAGKTEEVQEMIKAASLGTPTPPIGDDAGAEMLGNHS